MDKKIIRLTESDLHNIVKESVNKILSEMDWKTYANAAQKSYARGEDRANRFASAADKAFNRDYGTDNVQGDVYLKGRYGGGRSYNPNGDEGALALRSKAWDEKKYGRGVLSQHEKPSFKLQQQGIKDYEKEPFRSGGEFNTSKGIMRGNINGWGSDFGKEYDSFDDVTKSSFDKADNEFSNFAHDKYGYQKGKGWQLKK